MSVCSHLCLQKFSTVEEHNRLIPLGDMELIKLRLGVEELDFNTSGVGDLWRHFREVNNCRKLY